MDERETRAIRSAGTVLTLCWLGPLFYLPGAAGLVETIGSDWPWYSVYIFYVYYSYLFLLAGVLIVWKANAVDIWRLLGHVPGKAELIPAIKLTLFVFLFSIMAAYAVFYPLSYIAPEFVQWWYIESIEVILTDLNHVPFTANLFNFVFLVVIAPLLEEVTFRGFLLHRWTQKWGLRSAILVSSLLFGMPHADPVGASVFGVAMCVLYLRTQSLLVPILCHMANNLLVWIIEAGYLVFGESYDLYTLEDFQSEWYLGVISALIVIAWSYRYLSVPRARTQWRLPTL